MGKLDYGQFEAEVIKQGYLAQPESKDYRFFKREISYCDLSLVVFRPPSHRTWHFSVYNKSPDCKTLGISYIIYGKKGRTFDIKEFNKAQAKLVKHLQQVYIPNIIGKSVERLVEEWYVPLLKFRATKELEAIMKEKK